jgi:hypothetical protein
MELLSQVCLGRQRIPAYSSIPIAIDLNIEVNYAIVLLKADWNLQPIFAFIKDYKQVKQPRCPSNLTDLSCF